MAREKGPEEAIKYLVCFADNRRDFFGFGVDMGPGLPTKSTLLFYRMYNDPAKQNIILVEEDNPFVVMWRIDLETFKKHVAHILSLATKGEPFKNNSLPAHKIWRAMFSENIFEKVDAINHLIEFLRDYFSREQILFVAE